MKRILYSPYGGLGDNLQFSTLPEQISKKGEEFYIHKNSAYRNQEIFDLVWKHNPFCKGVSEEQPNIDTNIVSSNNLGHINTLEQNNSCELTDGLPKIYYKPNFLQNLSDMCVVNLSAISAKYTPEQVKIIKSMLPDNYLIVEFKHMTDSEHMVYYKDDIKRNKLLVKDIFELCDVLNSCKQYFCLHSGDATLSAAINKKNTVCFIGEQNHAANIHKLFIFNNIDYIFV